MPNNHHALSPDASLFLRELRDLLLDPLLLQVARSRVATPTTADAILDLRVNLLYSTQVRPGRAVLKGDCPFGAFTIERNVSHRWKVWVRPERPEEDHQSSGPHGSVLLVDGSRRVFVAEDALDQAVTLLRNILTDPDLELRGRAK